MPKNFILFFEKFTFSVILKVAKNDRMMECEKKTINNNKPLRIMNLRDIDSTVK